MKFLSAITLLAASVSARVPNPEDGDFSRYELSLIAPFDAPFNDGAVSLKGDTAGFYPLQTEAVVIDVQNGVDQGVHLSMGSRGFLDLAGDSGLKNLVLVGAEVVDEEGFTFQPSDADKFVYNVSRGKEGNWYVESVGEDNYELKWWDGEGFTVATVFPVQLVARLKAQS